MAANPTLMHAREVATRVVDRQLHARVDEVLTLVRAVLTEPKPDADTFEIKTALDAYSEFTVTTRGDHEKALTAAVNAVLASRAASPSTPAVVDGYQLASNPYDQNGGAI